MATIFETKLVWRNGTQWHSFPELGSIYTENLTIFDEDEGPYSISFRVEDGRRMGLLFVDVTYNDNEVTYCLGQFYTNEGAMKFAQFAYDHFVVEFNWKVCPSFQYVDYIDGEPYDLAGNEIVSEIVYG